MYVVQVEFLGGSFVCLSASFFFWWVGDGGMSTDLFMF